VIDTPPDVVFHAFTDQFDRWFAAPGSLVTSPFEGGLYRFETEMDGRRHGAPARDFFALQIFRIGNFLRGKGAARRPAADAASPGSVRRIY